MFSVGYTSGISEIFDIIGYDLVNDVYFSINHHLTNSARIQEFSQEMLNELIKIKFNNVKLHLVMNGYTYNQQIYLDENVDALINIIGMLPIDILTINNTILLKELKNRGLSENIEIKNSVNNKLKTLEDVITYHTFFNINSIMLDRSLNRNEDELLKIIDYCKLNNIKTTILLNEGCIPNCPYKSACDESISNNLNSVVNKISRLSCGGDFDLNPSITLKSPFVIPGTLNKYKDMGVDYFKIACRGKPLNEVFDRIKAYFFDNLNISIFNLVDTNPNGIYKRIFTHHLNDHNFYEKTRNCKNKCHECNYCDIIYKTIAKEVLKND
jgi:collagenase-like PrtC family protease